MTSSKEIRAVLMFGSDDREACRKVDEAIERVGRSVGRVERVSRSYRSEAYGFSSEREFVNRTAAVRTSLAAEELLDAVNGIEADMGRDREAEREQQRLSGERYASRPIDIDIVFYGNETISTERLTVPYHFLSEREYALRPLAEIVGGYRHPQLGKTPSEMLAEYESAHKDDLR